MNKEKVSNALINIISKGLLRVIDEIKISDTKEQLKYIEIADDYNIFELTDRIAAISKEYNVDKKDIYITSISEVGSYEGSSSLCASFKHIIKRSTKEIEDELKARISRNAYQIIYKEMISVGFNRIGFNSSYLEKFADTSVAEMIKSKDYERLVDYYSLYFDEGK